MTAIDDTYTTSLLHFIGADASTTFTDESGKTWTAQDGAQIDTAQYKFAPSSGLFDGSGDYISTPYTTDHNTGAGNFTIDLWVRFSSVAATATLFGRRTSDGTQKDLFAIYWLQSTSRLYFNVKANTVDKAEYYFSWSPSINTWYHVAVVRNTSTMYMFVNGTSQSLTEVTAVSTNNLDPTYGSPLSTIGRYGDYDGFYLAGWVDEFRFSKGIARWTANFTPPTSPYSSGKFKYIIMNA